MIITDEWLCHRGENDNITDDDVRWIEQQAFDADDCQHKGDQRQYRHNAQHGTMREVPLMSYSLSYSI